MQASVLLVLGAFTFCLVAVQYPQFLNQIPWEPIVKMSQPFDPLTATAADVQDLLSSGTVNSQQLVEIYLQQIEKHNGFLHAITASSPVDLIIAEAKRLDQERAEGLIRSPLHGVPILIKVRSVRYDLGIFPSLFLGYDRYRAEIQHEHDLRITALAGNHPSRNAAVIDKVS